MSTLRIHLFGKFRVLQDGSLLEGLNVHRVQELFCYLLLHRDHQHTREFLASLMWGEVSTAQSKKCLRHVLWLLQTALETAGQHTNILQVEKQWLRINPDADFWVDIDTFERAWAITKDVRGEALADDHVRALREAVQLYKGYLLEGNYEDWCLRERDRLHNLYLQMLNKLIEYCEKQHEYEAGLACGADILRYDRAHERTHRQLMRLHYLAGDRTAALRQYQQCVSILQEELCIEPDQATQTLYRHILEDRIHHASHPAVAADPTTQGTTSLLSRVLSHLKEIQQSQYSLQQQVEQNIVTLEQTLQDVQNPESRLGATMPMRKHTAHYTYQGLPSQEGYA